jgi:DNA polymerase III epsilon subunit-like protein
MKHIIWIDLETGGLDCDKFQITQIGGIVTELGPSFKRVGEPFERKVKLVPGRYTEEALKAQNFSIPVWDAEAVTIADALGALYKWAEPWADERTSAKGNTYKAADVAGFNVIFDADFLRAASKRNGVWLPLATWTSGMLDVLQLAKWTCALHGLEPPNFQLRSLCKFFDIDDAALTAHDALGDVLATLALFRALQNYEA